MLGVFRATDFRCLKNVELALDSRFNLIVGDNASGKTSLLEALAYLGRGKSFLGASTSNLLRHGQAEFVVFGELQHDERLIPVGVRNGRGGLEVRVNGEAAPGAAALAEALPLQIIDPEVHSLVAGGPEVRRRFLDWIAFHVEHEHLGLWRRYRRVLKQRNAGLKAMASSQEIQGWDKELVTIGGDLDNSRRAVLGVAYESLVAHGLELLGTELGFKYRSGWAKDKSLEAALSESLSRDRQYGATQVGPHRADLKIEYDERQARRLVSRGQQKLLASAMILAATETVQTALERPLLLLIDDPAAELDADSLQRLMGSVHKLGCQVVATSLNSAAIDLPEGASVFHVEQGVVALRP